jgi:hypothetical protein
LTPCGICCRKFRTASNAADLGRYAGNVALEFHG